jgi:hypothetical protein
MWALRVGAALGVVAVVVLVAFTSPAGTTVIVALTIAALVRPQVLDAIRQRPNLTLHSTTAGANTTERNGVRLAQVAVQLRLHNEGGEARSWKIELTTPGAGALNLYAGGGRENVIQDRSRTVWQSQPGEPVAHDAERQLDFHTELFPIIGGIIRAKVAISADRANPQERWLQVRTSSYSSQDAAFEAVILDEI